MKRSVPRAALLDLVSPHAPEGKQGRPPFAIETMLRINVTQQRFTLSDPAMEKTLHDVSSLREFASLGWASRRADQATILRFRHLIEKYKLTGQILTMVNNLPSGNGLPLKAGQRASEG